MHKLKLLQMNFLNIQGIPLTHSIIIHFLTIIHHVVYVSSAPTTSNDEIRWEPFSKLFINALIPSGWVADSPQYIANVQENGNTYIGTYTPGISSAIFWGNNGEGGYIRDYSDYNVKLLYYPKGSLHWVLVEGDEVPLFDMIPGGYVPYMKETEYICRIFLNGEQPNVLIGTYNSRSRECSAYYETEVTRRVHEVLVLSPYGKAIGVTVPSIN